MDQAAVSMVYLLWLQAGAGLVTSRREEARQVSFNPIQGTPDQSSILPGTSAA